MTPGSSIAAMTFTGPPQASQVSMSMLNTRRRRWAQVMERRGSIKPPPEWPMVWRNFISGIDMSELFEGRGDKREQIGILKKIKWPDKVRNLEMLGKHVNVNAFKEYREYTGPKGGPIQTITMQMTPQEAAEIYAATLHDE